MSTFTEFYINPNASGASNLNAGSTNGSPTYTSTGGNWNGSAIFTPTDGSTPSSSVSVGMFASVYVTSGATTTGYLSRVTAVGSGVNGTITLSTSNRAGTIPSTGSGTLTIVVGGAWAGPSGTTTFPLNISINGLSLFNTSSNPARINWQNTSAYNMTAAITDSTATMRHEGFNSTPGDGGLVTLSGGSSGTSFVLLTGGSSNMYKNFIFSGNGATGSANMVSGGTGTLYINCVFTGSVGNGLQSCKAFNCEAYGNNTSNTSSLAGFNSTNCLFCVSHHNTAGANAHGYLNCQITKCVAAANSGNGFLGNPGTILYGFVSYGNTLAGWNNNGNNAAGIVINCSFENNGTWGYIAQGGTLVNMTNCSFYNNTSGTIGSTTAAEMTIFQNNTIIPTASTMVSPSTGNFALNNTAGGGALLRAAGFDWEIVYNDSGAYSGTTQDYSDVGTAQSQCTGGANAYGFWG